VTADDQTDREIYAGRIVTLRLKYLRQPDGSVRLREIVEHAPGAAVVAIDADGQVLLVRQPRPAVDANLLELPAGLVDPGEQPIDTARTQRGQPRLQFAEARMDRGKARVAYPARSRNRLRIPVHTDQPASGSQPLQNQPAVTASAECRVHESAVVP